jgi:hypothetical protein
MYKIALAITIIFTSCSNHYHDGTYKANVFGTSGSLLDIHEEVLTIDGGDLKIDMVSIYNGKTLDQTKFTCEQYHDRIEYNNNGIIKILPATDTSIQINEYTFVKAVQ